MLHVAAIPFLQPSQKKNTVKSCNFWFQDGVSPIHIAGRAESLNHLVKLPDHFRADQKQIIKDIVQIIVTDSLEKLTISLGSLFQCLTTLLVKKCFLMSSLNIPWHSFEQFPCVLPLDIREKRSVPPSPLHLLKDLQRAGRKTFMVIES